MVAQQILVLLVGVRVLLGELEPVNRRLFLGWFVYRFRTRDSQSLKTGSTPVPTKTQTYDRNCYSGNKQFLFC